MDKSFEPYEVLEAVHKKLWFVPNKLLDMFGFLIMMQMVMR